MIYNYKCVDCADLSTGKDTIQKFCRKCGGNMIKVFEDFKTEVELRQKQIISFFDECSKCGKERHLFEGLCYNCFNELKGGIK